MQNRPGVEFLAAAQIYCVLLLKNMLCTNIDRRSSTIPPYWLIKSFHSTAYMYFCPQKMASEVPRPRSQGVYKTVKKIVLCVMCCFGAVKIQFKYTSLATLNVFREIQIICEIRNTLL